MEERNPAITSWNGRFILLLRPVLYIQTVVRDIYMGPMGNDGFFLANATKTPRQDIAPESPWKNGGWRLLSYGVSVTFQGRTVKRGEGISWIFQGSMVANLVGGFKPFEKY